MNQTCVDPLRTHRWVIREICGRGCDDLDDKAALLYAKKVSLPKFIDNEWTKATLKFYVVPTNARFLYEIAENSSGSIRIDATKTTETAGEKIEAKTNEEFIKKCIEHDDARAAGTWWLDNCKFISFEWDDLDYESTELLIATLVVKPQNVRYTDESSALI